MVIDVGGIAGFQSTHLLRGATYRLRADDVVVVISIHAPLTRCDYVCPGATFRSEIFQSTHLLRGATGKFIISSFRRFYFNPRTSYEVRRP